MNWETLEIENRVKELLNFELGQTNGDTRFGAYTQARVYLIEQVLPQIKALQPNMTDHGPDHIKNVLENIFDLLGGESSNLNCMELYVLILSALFHDAGNVFDREDHQKKIGPIYDLARPSTGSSQETEEKQIILNICRAHAGHNSDGSSDTLALLDNRLKLDRKLIRSAILASILRFADELAEGEQRTSHFMLNYHQYPKESVSFHRYAFSKIVNIDREEGRISLTFHIHLQKTSRFANLPNREQRGVNIQIKDLSNFLTFAYKRIEKLDQERRYTKHFCHFLAPFKETRAVFNFWFKGHQILLDLKPIILSDLVVPGEQSKSIAERYKDYNEKDLSKKIATVVKLEGN